MSQETDLVTEELKILVGLIARACEREADDAFLDEIRAYVDDPATGLCDEARKLAERGAHQLESALRAYDKAEDAKLWHDYLDASYAEHFLGVTPKGIEPTESCYLGDEHVLYAKQYFEVKGVMDDADFVVPRGFGEPADHIAMEWAFFGYLLDRDPDQAVQFKTRHMDAWMEQACKFIIDEDDVGFYTGIANLARAVLREVG